MAYISRCRGLRDRLLRCGGSILEEAFVTVIIAGLGPHWRSTRALLRAHGKISEAALCAEIHAEQQDMDLHEERHKKKVLALEFAFHTQRHYNNNNNRHNNRQVQQFSQRARWGLHLGIEKHYNAWKIFYVHSKETVAARDVIFYEQLTLQTYLDNLAANRDLTGDFRGNRAFASAADKADWDEQNVDNASEEAGPLPYYSVPIPMDDENPRESVNAETYFYFADTGYVTPQLVDTNISERIGPNFLPYPKAGDEAAYPKDTNLPRYTQSGLQILGLVTAVHRAEPPKEPATIQQALGGNTEKIGVKPWTKS
ncbi:unnamed protein product [Closterium sp. NIES-53]